MDELIYGVLRGVDVPGAGADGEQDERRLLVFAVDTRTHGAARLQVDLAELDRLDEADLPTDAAVTWFVYAIAGPAPAVAAAQARFVDQLAAELDRLLEDATADVVLADAEARLVGIERFDPERFADLTLLDVLGGDRPGRYYPVAVALSGDRAVQGVYVTDGTEDDAMHALIEDLLRAWLEVEAVPGRDRPWTARDTARQLDDPRAAFGVRLEPEADVAATLAAFARGLAERPEEWTVPRLEAEYRALFARLEASGRFRRGPDVQPRVQLEDWLQAQAERIARLRAGE